MLTNTNVNSSNHTKTNKLFIKFSNNRQLLDKFKSKHMYNNTYMVNIDNIFVENSYKKDLVRISK